MASQPDKLVDADFIREKDVILHTDVTSQRSPIGENAVVTHHAVMCNVDTDHNKVSGTNAGDLIFASGAMDSHALADPVVVPDDQKTALTLELYVLRLASEGGMLKHGVPFAQSGVTFDHGVCRDLASGADYHLRLDDSIGSDLNIGCNFGLGADNSSWMDRHAGTP